MLCDRHLVREVHRTPPLTTVLAIRQHSLRHAMHLSLTFWCAILSFTESQELPDSMSTSRIAAVPWITYTSTQSCTTQPSTVFVYTSNLTTFLLPQPGPNSAITPLDPNAASSAYDASISVASNNGLTTGVEGNTQASSADSGGFVSATGSEDPSATPINTTGLAQSTPWATESSAVTPSASSGDSGSFVSARGSEDSSMTPSNAAGVAQSTPLGTNIINPLKRVQHEKIWKSGRRPGVIFRYQDVLEVMSPSLERLVPVCKTSRHNPPITTTSYLLRTLPMDPGSNPGAANSSC